MTNKNKLILIFTVSLLGLLLLVKCNNNNDRNEKEINPNTNSISKVEIKTYLLGNSSEWGYDIYLEGRKYIEQKTIPCLQGSSGFKSESDAYKTANLVIQKINKNIIPPTITKVELESLGIIKK